MNGGGCCEILEVKELRLVDESGRMRARLAGCIQDGGPSIELYDDKGLIRVTIGLNGLGTTRIGVLNPSGAVAVGIGSRVDGDAGLQITGVNGMTSLHLSVHGNSNPQIDIYDGTGRALWSVP